MTGGDQEVTSLKTDGHLHSALLSLCFVAAGHSLAFCVIFDAQFSRCNQQPQNDGVSIAAAITSPTRLWTCRLSQQYP
jgi:hypothetical protein